MGSLSERRALGRGNTFINSRGLAGLTSQGRGGGGILWVDTKDFAETLKQIYTESGRTAEESVKYGMILILQSARADTPRGQLRRKVETGMNANGHKEEFFSVYYQYTSKPTIHALPAPKATRQSRRHAAEAGVAVDEAAQAERAALVAKWTPIQRVGTAKRSWGWAMWKATGRGARETYAREGATRDPISVRLAPLHIVVENALWWIEKIAPGITQRSVDKATRKMSHWLEHRWQSAFDRAGRRAA